MTDAKSRTKPAPASGNNGATTTTTPTSPSPNDNNASHFKKNNSFHYEFGGPIGTAATTLLLPVVVLALANFSHEGRINTNWGRDFWTAFWIDQQHFWKAFLKSRDLCPSCLAENDNDDDNGGGFVFVTCCGVLLGWFFFQVLLERFLPGPIVEGTLLRDGKTRLPYRINGHLAFWVSLLVVQVGWPRWDSRVERWQWGPAPLALLYDYFAELALASIVLSFAFSLLLYLSSWTQSGLALAPGGTSGHALYDFFMGRELNPRWGTLDWKEFCELRPGLIGWVLLNAGMAAKQYQLWGYVSGSMMLVNAFHFLYVWDALYQETAILTTMDITTDGFGFMLVFGDLTWVPFTYGLQTRFLVHHDPDLGAPLLGLIVALNVGGYLLFRCANGQKNDFRRDSTLPQVAHLRYLQTQRGTKLLTSGWWGMARKINYTGDWIQGLAWCLPCGWNSIVPYYYAIYFAILLIHRSERDDHLCQIKYGKDWEEYKRLVPHRFIPGVV